jgi:hypothetical protein
LARCYSADQTACCQFVVLDSLGVRDEPLHVGPEGSAAELTELVGVRSDGQRRVPVEVSDTECYLKWTKNSFQVFSLDDPDPTTLRVGGDKVDLAVKDETFFGRFLLCQV